MEGPLAWSSRDCGGRDCGYSHERYGSEGERCLRSSSALNRDAKPGLLPRQPADSPEPKGKRRDSPDRLVVVPSWTEMSLRQGQESATGGDACTRRATRIKDERWWRMQEVRRWTVKKVTRQAGVPKTKCLERRKVAWCLFRGSFSVMVRVGRQLSLAPAGGMNSFFFTTSF